MLPRPEASIDEEVWRQAEQLRTENTEVLSEPRAFTRLLTGLRSPRLTRAKLTSHPLFGALAHAPFAAVLERASG